jgi:hypothetical protein
MLYTMQQLRERLGDRRLTVVAQATGIAYDRLWRLMTAKQEATESDLAALTAYVERQQA